MRIAAKVDTDQSFLGENDKDKGEGVVISKLYICTFFKKFTILVPRSIPVVEAEMVETSK
jgi:hypothetical protein